MITLKEAIRLLDLSDQNMVYLCTERFQMFAPYLTVKQIREKYDMQRTKVLRIYPYHFKYSEDHDYELIIRETTEK